jgi:AFG3 family protein
LLEKDTIDLNGVIEILGDRPFPPKSNFKAYLESKKQQKEEGKIGENLSQNPAV